jgi:hypothetical protein
VIVERDLIDVAVYPVAILEIVSNETVDDLQGGKQGE